MADDNRSYEATPSKKDLLNKIEETFSKLYQKYGEAKIRTLDSISADICRQDLETYGIFLVKDVTDQEIWDYNLEVLAIEMYRIIFDVLEAKWNHPDFLSVYDTTEKRHSDFSVNELRLAALCSFWNSSHGFGNSSFRFIYMMFLDKNPQFKIGNESIEFNYNPIHRHNLNLLASQPQLWQLLKDMYSNSHPMVSWDSQKVRFVDSGRKKSPLSKISKPSPTTMTIRHHDIYTYGGVEMDRLQAMIIMQQPKAVKLGFVLFSNHPEIRELFRLYFGKPSHNFGTVEDEFLNPILDKYWRAPREGFIIWNQATVHYEGIGTEEYLSKYISDKPKAENLSAFSFRAVIGTHTPKQLSQEDLKQMAFLSEHGWLPEIYTKNKKHNNNTNISANIVNSKTTQYNIPRQMTNMETQILEFTKNKYNSEEIDKFISEIDPIKREMYGLY